METIKRQQARDELPHWLVGILSAFAGALVLYGTWFWYRERLPTPGADWLAWVQPILLVCCGLLCFVAAALLAVRQPRGREVLGLAIGFIPVIFAARLVVVVFRVIGKALGWLRASATALTFGNLSDWLRDHSRSVAINLVLLVAVLIGAYLKHRDKPAAPVAGTYDER